MNQSPQESHKLSLDAANELVVENKGWAESIARSVARSWNLDWQLDGLDGAAMEALIFCARRFEPGRGVPFRGYARKRIHEASTEAARRSRGWKKGLGANSATDQRAREVSAELFAIFPELREGQLPYSEDEGGGDGDLRGSIRQLLVGASIVAAKQGLDTSLPDEVMDYKKMIGLMALLDAVHQQLLWEVYWEGHSMRTVAASWEVDELSVIREHKSILAQLQKGFAMKRGSSTTKLKVRPALKQIAVALGKKGLPPPFSRLLQKA